MGKMLTGWLSDGTNKYYMDPASGIMSTAWMQIDGYYHYFNNSGHMLTGWIQINGSYYYLDPADGRMVANTTRTIDGVTYQFASNGVCNTNVNNNNAFNPSNNNNNSPNASAPGNGNNSGGPGASSNNGNSSPNPSSPPSNSSFPGTSAPNHSSGDDLQAGLTGGPKP